MGDSASGAYVIADGRRFETGWKFNSLFRNDARNENPQSITFCSSTLWVGGSSARNLCSIREGYLDGLSNAPIPQHPFSVRAAVFLKGVVEHPFSPGKTSPQSYERALESYISDTLGGAATA